MNGFFNGTIVHLTVTVEYVPMPRKIDGKKSKSLHYWVKKKFLVVYPELSIDPEKNKENTLYFKGHPK